MPTDVHAIARLAPDAVYGALTTSSAGLDSVEAAKRLQQAGPNQLLTRTRFRRFIAPFVAAVRPILLPLWVAVGLAYLVGEPGIGFVLLVVALINALVGAWLEWKAERAATALGDALPSYAHVIRDGRDAHIIAEQVVPGDLLLLHSGETIPADARVVVEHDLRTVNVALMGEAAAHRKIAVAVMDDAEAQLTTDLPNIVYAGGRVVSGTGQAVVYATGRKTAYGAIAALTETAHEAPSPLAWVFVRLGGVVMALATVAVTGGLLLVRSRVAIDTHSAALIAIGLLTAAVPTGLMPGITVTLVEGWRRLAARGAIVRRLSSVETLGATTVICADKTGTLTQNEMTVRELWTADGVITVGGIGFNPAGSFTADGATLDQKTVQRRAGALLQACVMTSSARLLPPDTLRPAWHILGDPVEAALVVAATKAGYQAGEMQNGAHQTVVLPATADVSLEGRMVEAQGKTMAYLKGPVNALLPRCSTILAATGERALTDNDRLAVKRVLRSCERGAVRTIAFARRQAPQAIGDPASLDLNHNLVFLGVVAVLDPPRQEVEESIRACHRAGIRTMMLTGDYLLGAESLARRCALVESSRATTITGPDLAQMDDATLRERLRVGDIVFARMTPEHKVRIVETLDAMGEVVLVTGGAANDVPAIKAADIGFAMGTSSSPAAREAADVILEHDNFAAVADSITEGRAVEQRARRLVAINLAVTMLKLMAYLLALAFGWPLLLTVGQLLLLDVLGGFLPAIAMGAGPPDPRLMQRRPRRSGRSLIDGRVYRLGYTWFGALGTLAAVVAAVLVMFATGLGFGADELTGQLPFADRLVSPPYPEVTTGYIAVGLAALAGAGLRFRATTRRYPLGRVLMAFVLVGMAATLVALTRLPTLPPFGHLSAPPWWLWLMALAVIPVTAALEWGRQKIDRMPK